MVSMLALLLACAGGDGKHDGGSPDGGADDGGTADGGAPDGGGSGDGGGGDGGSESSDYIPLDPPRLLRRMSLDLRGVLPSVDELDAVEADPEQLTALRDAWMEDPRFEERLIHLYAARWHTRVDAYLLQYTEYLSSTDPTREYEFERMVGEEPLRLIARVIAEDRPWSEVVQADWTMGTALMAEAWPVEHGGGEGWQPSRYTDGRPAAGVLSTNGLWWRYFSTVTNYNRGRVAALTRLLICEDYQSRTISFAEASGDLGEGTVVEDALREDPYCMGCHSAIDPIAATLFGFWPANEYNADEVDTYHPEREAQAAVLLQTQGQWYGDPVQGMVELGAHIAADPRFERCAVQTAAELLWRRPARIEDFDRIDALALVYAANEGRMKPVLRAILDDEVYQAGDVASEKTSDEVTARMLAPDQLQSAMEELTGFRWTWQGYDQLDNDTIGYRVMSGGVDGDLATSALPAPNLTTVLIHQRVAEAAASHALSGGLPGTTGSLPSALTGVSEATRPGEAAFDLALSTLVWRLHAERADADQLALLSGLWSEVEAVDGASAAWQAVLIVLLRDPAFLVDG